MGRILGNQTPTFQNFSEDCFHYQHQIMEDEKINLLLSLFDIKLLKWQMLIVKKLLLSNEKGTEYDSKLLVKTLGLLVPRQNGKSQILIAYIIISLLLGRSGIYSSFLTTSATEIFFRVKEHLAKNDKIFALFEFSSDESKLKKVKMKALKGEKEPYFVFVTRGGNFGRGFTDLDLLIYDEAQNIKESQIAGVEATISTSSAPQQIFMGTPALPILDAKTGKSAADNDYFHILKKHILGAKSITKIWVEWSADQIYEPGNEAIIAKYNPSFNHDLGNGKRIGMSAFETNSTNLNFSIERLGYQIESTVFGEREVLSPEIIPSIVKSNEFLLENFTQKGKYILSIKSTLNGSKIYVVKTMRSKDKKKYYTSIVDIFYKEDELYGEKLSRLVYEENRKLQCKHIIIDGQIRSVIRAALIQLKKWSASGNQSSQGKISFATVHNVTESFSVFCQKYNSGEILFNEKFESTMKDLIPSIQRRNVSGGHGFTSGTMDAEIIDSFALGVLEANKRII